jgi:hypothetical protein
VAEEFTVLMNDEVPGDEIWVSYGGQVVLKLRNVEIDSDGRFTATLPDDSLLRHMLRGPLTQDGYSIAEPLDVPMLCERRPASLW